MTLAGLIGMGIAAWYSGPAGHLVRISGAPRWLVSNGLALLSRGVHWQYVLMGLVLAPIGPAVFHWIRSRPVKRGCYTVSSLALVLAADPWVISLVFLTLSITIIVVIGLVVLEVVRG